METVWLILFNISIAAFVGGITNHFAIKMLFLPRTEKRIGRWRIPFTPGLIPKRKDEIARSLGHIVADHLVTRDSLVELMQKPHFRNRVMGGLERLLESWASRDETVEEILLRFWSREQLEAAKKVLVARLDSLAERGLDRLWNQVADKPLGSLVSGWTEEKREVLAGKAADVLLKELRRELDSFRGERLLKQWTGQLMDQTGGFLGTLAGLFMDGDRVAGKLKSALLQQLDSPQVNMAVTQWIRERLIRLEQLSLAEAVKSAAGRDGREWLGEQAARWIDWEGWSRNLLERKVSEMAPGIREWIKERLPYLADGLLNLLAGQMDHLLESVQLPELVEAEVRKFPIEQVEEIVLNVSGKEFRAITWLGVLLGGMIGVIQSILYLFGP